MIADYDELLGNVSINLNRLQPNHAYTIWVQAYSTETMFTVSDQTKIVTFPEPDDIHLVYNSSTELSISWVPHQHISR